MPGVTASGTDIGQWLQRQREHVVWEQLTAGQRERLTALGVTPLPPVKPETTAVGSETGGKRSKGMSAAFLRGCSALEQYRARTGTVEAVSRSHTEVLADGTAVRLGVWLSNTKVRRATLSREQVERLAGLGLEWARIQGREGAV
ncbi:helicase associated domain-containing protein [Streptomyces sp. NPDC007903]|uniref:helicase associated domain-containing protein n=1 Tax=Streptomyces sp. NPDC007903 TaxID=3364786 RepID=UPI0036EDD67B